MILQGDFQPESGYTSALKLFRQQQPPTAVFAFNDMMAIGVQRAAVELGLHVPEDISLIGFDNIAESAYFYPALTTISQDLQLLGEQAVQNVVEMIQARQENKPVIARSQIIKTTLVVRESSRLIWVLSCFHYAVTMICGRNKSKGGDVINI